jgi:hypothetical protein
MGFGPRLPTVIGFPPGAFLRPRKRIQKKATLNNCMEREKKSTRGGYRPGSGRPKGGGNKVTAQDLLDAAQAQLGRPFVESLMSGYIESITQNDRKIRVIYEKMIIDKVVADRRQVEVEDSEDSVEAKRQAFATALAALTAIGKKP